MYKHRLQNDLYWQVEVDLAIEHYWWWLPNSVTGISTCVSHFVNWPTCSRRNQQVFIAVSGQQFLHDLVLFA